MRIFAWRRKLAGLPLWTQVCVGRGWPGPVGFIVSPPSSDAILAYGAGRTPREAFLDFCSDYTQRYEWCLEDGIEALGDRGSAEFQRMCELGDATDCIISRYRLHRMQEHGEFITLEELIAKYHLDDEDDTRC